MLIRNGSLSDFYMPIKPFSASSSSKASIPARMALICCSKRCSSIVFLVNMHTSISSTVGSKQTHKRDGALKHFVRSFTDLHHRDGVDSQILEPGGNNFQVSDGHGEAKLSQGKIFALRMSLARFKNCSLCPAKASSARQWGFVNDPTKLLSRVDIADYIKNEEPAAETSLLQKAIQPESETCLGFHSPVIKTHNTSSLHRELLRKVEFLHSESVPLSHTKLLLKKRAFVFASPENLEAVVKVLTEFFESKSIAFDVLKANAGILERPLENLKHRLRILEEFGVGREACIKVGNNPGMLTVKLETYEEALNFLRGLGLGAQARSNLIRRRPIVLRHKESSMRTTMDFFESIGSPRQKLLKLLELRPSVFDASIDKNLMVKFKLLQDRGFSVKHFVNALQFVSQMSNEQIIMRFNLLRDQGLPPEFVSKILMQKPFVLALSTQDLKIKLDFLVHTLKRDILEVHMFPAYLVFSFERRIAPRFRALEAVRLCEPPCLSRILGVKTSVFKQQFNIPDSVMC